ncbi:RAMP superfamily CRISPR-associated protein [Limnoraphis robusta]|uniref:RAMP superfamily CRISPR-associated protein n=1 Tax=Limnoraphis robusta CCNP1315 TaxID=3110306 RepID=A0ABU5TWT3_9CYAN|nr:RAMP superfamily CRISPR-associated protein [Limnoraphis robusta]MEA5519003.1 RAMP superfamily CRISPR-associated protein [Limnoraphis robusta CCNP1315]MEA5544025.1 RAMP superfamily CRISPR-associated protein [Limnoraphis robusta CCNP1324]
MTELRHKSNRHIVKRIIVRGTLILDTPTCLGSGDTDSPTDLALLRDSISNDALLIGSSIAGALRNYLREQNKGYGESDTRHDIATKLFGDLFSYKNEQNESETKRIELREQDTQSSLIIDDAISTQPIQSELRDGVKINSMTRTAAAQAKYDLELLQAGTEFPLCFELLIEAEDRKITLIKAIATEMQLAETNYFSNFFFKWLAYRYKNKATLLKSLAIALSGLQQGEISLGMKKRRGFGRCHVKEWQVWYFNLEDANDRILWLNFEHWRTGFIPIFNVYTSIREGLTQAGLQVAEDWEDKRDRFTIQATFKLVSSLLIRSGQAETGRAPDVVHLKSHRQGKTDPESILSGTSLAGVLRHRAERIVNTLEKPTTIIDEIFGPDFSQDKTKKAKASRLIVHETTINHTTDLVQTRIAIDRFTGGAYHGALFQEQPVFANDETELKLEIELRNPIEHEIGLLLLLLKDLWTEDLPVGGSSSVGRGRLQGIKADLIWTKEQKSWKIAQPDLSKNSLEITGSDRQDLENYVNRLVEYAQQETTKNDQA